MKRIPSLRWMPVLLLMVAACSGEPTRPDAAWQPQFGKGDNGVGYGPPAAQPDLRHIAKFEQRPTRPQPGQDHKLIGSEGGSLRIGDFEIVVPAGAVDKPTQFYIHLPVDPRLAWRAYAEFGPHQTFLKPVTIRVPSAGTNAADLDPVVAWWQGRYWVPFPTTPTSDGRLEAQTSHFSYYGTYLRKGLTTLGG